MGFRTSPPVPRTATGQGRERSRNRHERGRDDRYSEHDRHRSPRRRLSKGPRGHGRLNPVEEEREEDLRQTSQGASSSQGQPRLLSRERAALEEEVTRLQAELDAKDIILAEASEEARTHKRRAEFLLDHDGGDDRKGEIRWNAEWVAREHEREQNVLRLEAQLAELGAQKLDLEDEVDDAEQQGFRPGHRESTTAARDKLRR